jgi:hypothetical protein
MFDDDHLEMLTGSYLKVLVSRYNKSSEADYEVTEKAFEGFKDKFSLKEWNEARIIVMSRVFGFAKGGKDE